MAAFSPKIEIDLQVIDVQTRAPISEIIEVETETLPLAGAPGSVLEFSEPLVFHITASTVAAVAVCARRPDQGTYASFVTSNTYMVDGGGQLSLTALTMTGTGVL